MKVLLIGKGAREHAIAWKLAKSPLVDDLYLWPGNPGMASLGREFAVPSTCSHAQLAEAAAAEGINMVVVGPEGPLAEGLADELLSQGVPCFGPTAAAARLESSKAFSKDLMFRAGIPTAQFDLAQTREECAKLAEDHLNRSAGVVLKASGLAGGKGVFVCRNMLDVEQGLDRLYGSMRTAAETVVVEEFLEGRECSYFTFLGYGEPIRLGFAVDFKRLNENDQGPNTGGMGCYTPVPWLPEGAAEVVEQTVIEPLLRELDKIGITYVGCLYVGLMWTNSGPKVIEFNVRLGDPECQIIATADSRDWAALMFEKTGVSKPQINVGEISQAAVGVVMASSGYPYGEGETDGVVLGPAILEHSHDTQVFVASASRLDDGLKTGHGRVLTVIGTADSLARARHLAYQRVELIAKDWPDAKWRRDIAQRVVEES